MGRGGKRDGAGRKPSRPTVVRRVPEDLADKLDKVEELFALLEDWKARSEDAPATSPRWERCRELLSQVGELGF